MRRMLALVLGVGLMSGAPTVIAQEEGPGGAPPPPPPGGGSRSYGSSSIPGYRLIAINACNETSSMAYRVRDYTTIWVTRGWFNIRPGQTRTLSMPTRNTTFYYYGRSVSGRTWNGRGQPGARRRWVRRKAFLHGAGVLTGDGARQVWFRKREVNRNTGSYRLRMTCRQ